MTLEDDLRAALRADAVSHADITLTYPGDPAPRRRLPRAAPVLAAAAATVALVGGVVWGGSAGGEKVQPAARHVVVPRHPQEHTAKDIPAAVAALPRVRSGLKALAPVEDAAIVECMRAAGYQDLPPAPRAYVVDSAHDRESLTVAQAQRDGYGLAPLSAQYAADMIAQHAWEEKHPTKELQDAVYSVLGGSQGTLPEDLTVGPMGVGGPYGGCVGQVRQRLYGRVEIARVQIDNWPGADMPVGGRSSEAHARTPLIGMLDRTGDFVPANARWARCMRAEGARDLVVRHMPVPPVEAALGLEGDPDRLMERIARWQTDSLVAPLDTALERRVAVVDARCAASTGYLRVAQRLIVAGGLDPASLMRAQPELIDAVLDLDAAIRRLRAELRRS